MRFGTIVHEAILEPTTFMEKAIIVPEFSGTGSRNAKLEWFQENHGKIHVSRDQMDQVHGILNSLTKNACAYKYLARGKAEESGFWRDPDSGIECKYRSDFDHEQHILVDVKTTMDAKYGAFQAVVARLNYHVQAAMHLDGASATSGRHYDEFVIIAIEKEPPYEIGLFNLDPIMINEGRALYLNALKTLKKCRETGIYPGYPQQLIPISLPSWAFGASDE